MLAIQRNISLANYNTFGINAMANYFVSIQSQTQLEELAKTEEWSLPQLVLGGGSNVLLASDFSGMVVLMETKGIEVVESNANEVLVKVQAGENWHKFVLHAIDNNWGGIENLSLIPGCVGASPMQNIGAYGVEIEQVFHSLTAFHKGKKEFHTFKKDQCNFGYRTSVFKTSEKGNYIITDVTFKLTNTNHQLNTSYGAISNTLRERGINKPTIKDISNAVISIRESKLPDPKIIGNSGSFFKNPIVSRSEFLNVQKKYPKMPFYEVSETEVKIPAGWLIEQCGFKGKQVGNTGTYEHQALIIVNYGNATGSEIWNFANKIQHAVNQQFSIELEPEVNLIQNGN